MVEVRDWVVARPCRGSFVENMQGKGHSMLNRYLRWSPVKFTASLYLLLLELPLAAAVHVTVLDFSPLVNDLRPHKLLTDSDCPSVDRKLNLKELNTFASGSHLSEEQLPYQIQDGSRANTRVSQDSCQ